MVTKRVEPREVGRAAVAAALMLMVFLSSMTAAAASPSSNAACAPGVQTMCLEASPEAGPVGTHVEVAGKVAKSSIGEWRRVLAFKHLVRFLTTQGDDCQLVVPMRNLALHVSDDADVTGSFEVGSHASCLRPTSDGSRGSQPAPAGRYAIVVGSYSGAVGHFEITQQQATLPFTGLPISVAASGIGALLLGLLLTLAGGGQSRHGRRQGAARNG